MSYLTQILVDYERAVRQLHIRDSYDWHQRVWQSFGHLNDVPKRGVYSKGTTSDAQSKINAASPPHHLSRVDEVDDSYRLLIVSPTAPTRPDWCPTDCFQTKTIPADYFAPGRFRFSLLANPTRKVRSVKDGNRTKNGRRLPITKREELITWMQRKAAEGGFDIGDSETLRTVPRPRSYFSRKGAHGVHFAVEFQGFLTVTDPTAFQTTFTTGIGSAKAFGFGLLAIAPIA